MRFFAALYAVGALLAGITRTSARDPLPWILVCGVAAALGLAAATYRPLLMPSAAHAGLTATWAGTLAARQFHAGGFAPSPSTLAMLLMLCGGMAVLVTAGLKSAQPAKTRVEVPK